MAETDFVLPLPEFTLLPLNAVERELGGCAPLRWRPHLIVMRGGREILRFEFDSEIVFEDIIRDARVVATWLECAPTLTLEEALYLIKSYRIPDDPSTTVGILVNPTLEERRTKIAAFLRAMPLFQGGEGV
jgi:hypothetical protein